jgi:phosphoribosylanthranilate isomerase
VGVFVDAALNDVNAISHFCALDLVQLCGGESPAYCEGVRWPVVRVLRAGGSGWSADRLAEAQRGFRVHRFMIDSHRDGFYGGTGETSDWQSLAGLMDDKILAGGLRPDNVAEALAGTGAWGVDVSSGVERDGRKDAHLVRAFIEKVKRFDSSTPRAADTRNGARIHREGKAL